MSNIEILVADDDSISAKILENQLIHLTYTVTCVENGEEAWKLLQAHPDKFSVVIADRIMPGIDGIALLNLMKKNPKLADIPVIIQTGEAETEDYIGAIRAGAFDFIYKPVEEVLLMHVVKNALTKHSRAKQISFGDL